MKTLLLSKIENQNNCGTVGDHTPTFVKTPERKWRKFCSYRKSQAGKILGPQVKYNLFNNNILSYTGEKLSH